ncbi:MAG: class I SAM-dependent methyltransferase [Kiloniellales bacterium]
MSGSDLPDDAVSRVTWAINAETQEELRRRYDLWAAKYDQDIGRVDDYLAPLATAEVAKQYLARDARILDAGAGTGLSGEALKEAGFQDILGLDFSPGMLAVAEKKGIYRETLVADLSQETALEANAFDAVVTVGTTSQMPSEAFYEFMRVVRPGGRIVVTTWVKAYVERGFAAIQERYEREGRLALIHKGEPFQGLPTTEPEIVYEVWVFDVLS